MSKIYLVSMPFMPVQWPSIGIGQLVSAAKNEGMEVKALYAYFTFAEKLGLPMYNFLSVILRPYSQPHSLLTEWFFSRLAFGEDEARNDDDYLRLSFKDNSRFLRMARAAGYQHDEEFFIHEFREIREKSEQFVKETARKIVDDGAEIVGCSSSFMQYNASLALLRVIKHIRPSIVTMLGGANCEAELGFVTAKNFEWVDFVVSGEADTIFPYLCKKLLSTGPNIAIQDLPSGVYCQKKISAGHLSTGRLSNSEIETAYIENMDDVPIPDYGDYFSQLEQTSFSQQLERMLVMETSRGCWKGAKHPCYFCGLNGKRIQYRAKSPARVIRELEQVSAVYDIQNIIMTDTILHTQHFEELFIQLAQKNKPYKLFFETRSNLTEAQVKLLADAGVTWIQPGIESFHNELLKLLNKRSSALHNIALLKYALEHGIKSTWYILHDIPGDRDEYYQEMADFLPWLAHLEPPFFVRKIRFDRFSEYYRQPDRFGLKLAPLKNYAYVYPFSPEDLDDFANFFENEKDASLSETGRTGLDDLKRKILVWKLQFYELKNRPRAELQIEETPSQTVIYDSRPCATSETSILTENENLIYRHCRKPIARTQLYRVALADNTLAISKPEVEAILRNLIEKKLLLFMDDHYLALANYQPARKLPNAPTGF